MDDETYDVAIVGGGIVGCASLFHFTNLGYKCVLLEKNKQLVTGASSGNSGMLHTGFDAPIGSLELRCIQENQREVFDILDKLELPYNKIGATMVAWNQQEVMKLRDVIHHSQQAKVTNVNELSLSDLFRREPYLSRDAAAAIHIPDETVVDPWLTPIMFAEHARHKGAKIYTNTLINGFEFDNTMGIWTVSSENNTFKARLVLNCAGLFGDVIHHLLRPSLPVFKIKPRKGQYIVFDRQAKGMISSSILPVPTEVTKGVIVFKSVYDNVIIGPTADETNQRCPNPSIDDTITRLLTKHGRKTVPPLLDYNIVNMYTGVRPATENKDYQIIASAESNFITVGGIRSTGLSACLGIAKYVYQLVREEIGVEPSINTSETVQKMEYVFSNRGSVVFPNGIEHYITHPLTYSGICLDTKYSSRL